MVAMVVSLTVFAYLLGEISNLVMDQDAELVKIRSQVSSCSTAASHMSLGSSAGLSQHGMLPLALLLLQQLMVPVCWLAPDLAQCLPQD